MTVILTLNIILAALVIVAVVAPLFWSIRISHPTTEAAPASRAVHERTRRARAAHAARARVYATDSI
jgi:hypothetical protein